MSLLDDEVPTVVRDCKCVDCKRKWSYTVAVDSAAASRKYSRCWDCAAQVHNAYQEYIWKHRGFSH